MEKVTTFNCNLSDLRTEISIKLITVILNLKIKAVKAGVMLMEKIFSFNQGISAEELFQLIRTQFIRVVGKEYQTAKKIVQQEKGIALLPCQLILIDPFYSISQDEYIRVIAEKKPI